MSALSSSRRVNSWLSAKRWFQALAGKAGGTIVETTVDQTLMRGSEPHDRWCVAELPQSRNLHRIRIRQIVDARVLLTATVPPALPVKSMFDG
jgi:hypothetical protein